MIDAGNHLGKCEADGERGYDENKAREGSRDANIEENALVVDGGADADECSQRARYRGRGRKKERQRGIDAVIDAGEVVAEFMGHEDGEEREGKRQAGAEECKTAEADGEDIEVAFEIEKGQVAIEIPCHVRAHQCGGEKGQGEQEQMEPEPAEGRSGRRVFRGFKPASRWRKQCRIFG